MDIYSLLNFLLFGALALIVVSVALQFTHLRARRRQGPECGRCGYSLIGATSLICPECGGDIRRVGVRTSWDAPLRRADTLARLTWFTSAVLLCGLISLGAGMALLPTRTEFDHQIRLGKPRSFSYAEVIIRATGSADATRPVRLPTRVTIEHLGARPPGAHLDVDLDKGRLTYTEANGRKTQAFDSFGAAAVLTLLELEGLNVNDEAVRAEAAEIATLVRHVAQTVALPSAGASTSSSGPSWRGGAFTTRGSSEHRRAGPPLWGVILLCVPWVAIWVAGAIFLWRTRPTA